MCRTCGAALDKAGAPESSTPVASRQRAQGDDDSESHQDEFIVSDDDFSGMSIEYKEINPSKGGH